MQWSVDLYTMFKNYLSHTCFLTCRLNSITTIAEGSNIFLYVAARRAWIKAWPDGPMLDIIDRGQSVDPWWTYQGHSAIRFRGFAGIPGVEW